MERGHYVDMEVVAAAVCRVRGPVPTFEELDAVADLLRRPGNHRSVTHSENVGVERAAAAAVIRGHAGALLAQQVAKIRRSFAFLMSVRAEFTAVSPSYALCDVPFCPGE